MVASPNEKERERKERQKENPERIDAASADPTFSPPPFSHFPLFSPSTPFFCSIQAMNIITTALSRKGENRLTSTENGEYFFCHRSRLFFLNFADAEFGGRSIISVILGIERRDNYCTTSVETLDTDRRDSQTERER